METFETARYWLGVLVLATWFPAIFPWLLIHPLINFWRRIGKKKMWAMIAPCSIAAMAALAYFRDALIGKDLGTHVPVVVLGAILLIAGFILDYKRRAYLTTKILVGNPEIDNDASNLLTGGPYAYVRHPRYVAITLSYLGFAVLGNFSGVYIYFAATLPFFAVVILLEEAELKERFGKAYEVYSRTTPRFIPRFGKNK